MWRVGRVWLKKIKIEEHFSCGVGWWGFGLITSSEICQNIWIEDPKTALRNFVICCELLYIFNELYLVL